MRIRIFLLLIFFCLVENTGVACGKNVKINTGSDIKRIATPGTRYIISGSIDLKNQTIEMPAQCILEFADGGLLSNGTIIGKSSVIKAPQRLILQNMVVDGDWDNKEVYSNWVNLAENYADNTQNFRNLMKLCNGSRLTHFYMQEGKYYVSAVKGSTSILVPSNTYWHNSATICMLPSDYDKYFIVYLNMADNVTIDGGEFIGDALNHTGTTGELGHGIKCGGARNVRLANLTVSYCWGDGIDLIEGLYKGQVSRICDKIIIENVKCLHNRRQGMSIEAASNLQVSNCEFAYTGSPLYTAPGCGVDIEPWDNSCDKVWNVSFTNCKMHHNKNYDFICEPNVSKKEKYKQLKNNVYLSNCQIGAALVRYVYGVKLSKCTVSDKLSMTMAEDILIKDSHIEDYSKTVFVNKLQFKRCTGRKIK